MHAMKLSAAALGLALLASGNAQGTELPVEVRLAVTDEKSGVTVTVSFDQRTLVAQQQGGKVLWTAEVIEKKDGKPSVDEPMVRRLVLHDTKVGAAYGKHSFSLFDLKTGKLLSSEEAPVPPCPSVTCEKTGVTVSVAEDHRTLVAQDKEGKVLWKVDVIDKTPGPPCGDPVIRYLGLGDQAVGVVYFKAAFASIDLKTGKMDFLGSD